MGMLLLLVGGGWALLGAMNFIGAADKGLSEGWMAFALIFNGVLFVLPGLMLAGLGSSLRAKRAKRTN